MTKADLRIQAEDLRRQGCSVPDIARRLGVARSTAYLWTGHLPLDGCPAAAEERRRRHMEHMREVRWEPHRRARDAERGATHEGEAAEVGALSEREIRLLGAVTYWCEGTKEKPWRQNVGGVQFINSDERLIRLFVRFLEVEGLDRRDLSYRLSIHESADVKAATEFWAGVVGMPPEIFRKPTLKKHNPSTVRRNTAAEYQGCLIIYVPKSRRLYWRIEGIMAGIARGVDLGDSG